MGALIFLIFTIFDNDSFKEPLVNGCADFSYIFFTLFSNGFDQIIIVKYLFYFLVLTDLSSSMTFALTDCHIFFHLTVNSSQFNDQKIKIRKIKSHGFNLLSSVFIYKKRYERQREKEERNKRDTKNKDQNQTISSSNGHNFW
jgi:hypothetical protein